MLKAVYHLKNVSIEADGEDIKEVLGLLSPALEFFAEPRCGLCGCEDLRPNVRKVGEGKGAFTYYELHCTKCHARLSYGQAKSGDSLFPKRRLDKDGRPDNENGSYGPHNGWTKFKGYPKEEEAAESDEQTAQVAKSARPARR